MSLISIIICVIIGGVILWPLIKSAGFKRDLCKILSYKASPTEEELKENLLPTRPETPKKNLPIQPETKKKPHDEVASSAQHLQAHAQKLIFTFLSLLLIAKGIIEILDTMDMFEKVNVIHSIYYWTVNDFHSVKLIWTESIDKWPLIAHIRHIKTLTYVANALAISCGLQLAYMLITEGPDEAVEPIMLGIASVILLILSTIEPNQWNIYNSVSIILLILGIFLLNYMSGKIKKG